MDGLAPDVQQELMRLRNEVHAKDETLNQLKLKTKSFVDNLRNELAAEKKKVTALEEKLKHSAEPQQSVSSGSEAEIERLKKEIATISHHENELKVRAKTFADNMKAQLQAEKDKTCKLEKELQEKTTALAAKMSSSYDLLGGFDDAAAAKNDQEMAALKSQLQAAQQDAMSSKDKVTQQAQEIEQLKRSMDSIKAASDQQIERVQNEMQQLRQLEQTHASAQGSAEAAFAQEHGQLEAALRRAQELAHNLEQFKIENEHLQKQLQDKDFQLEQMESYRQRADENEEIANTLRGELASISTQLAAKEQEAHQACDKCDELKHELSEMSTLYEKVNMGRSQSDLQLAEAQTALSGLQSVKQGLEASQSRVEEMNKQNMQLCEQLFQKDSQISALKSDVQRLTSEMAKLNETLNASKSDSFTRKQQSQSLEADKKKAEDALREALAKADALEKKNKELAASVEAVTKDSNEKRQKAKVLVVSLTTEKQALVDARAELQKEVDRLRMELNQKNVENERRVKQIQEENQQRIAQSATAARTLSEEVSTLKQTLMLVQESERNQQRAKELANAKREVEDSNKKRLAAKAETQKLAIELESVQKCLNQLADSTATSCTTSVKKMNHLQDRVNEALQVLEKRAAAFGKKGASSSSSADVEVEDLRGAETVSMRPTSPTSGAKKVEDNIARVMDKLAVVVEVTDKLCDLSIEQNDVNLKDVVVDKFTQLFTQCFSEKVRAAYSKVEDAAENGGLMTKS